MGGFKGHADGQGRGDQTVAKLAVITMTSQWQRPGWREWTSFGYVISPCSGIWACKVLWPSCICVQVVICMILCGTWAEVKVQRDREKVGGQTHTDFVHFLWNEGSGVSSQIVSHHRVV